MGLRDMRRRLTASVEDLDPLPNSGDFGDNEANSDFLFIVPGAENAPTPPNH